MNLIKKFRKPYLAIFFSISILSTSLTSCSSNINEDITLQNETNYLNRESQELSFKVKFLDYVTLKNLAIEVHQIESSGLSDNEKNIQIKETLEPMILNGKEIHREILNQVDLSDSKFELNHDDINQITAMDDLELAQLSFVYSTAHASVEWDTDTVMNCLGAALGLHEIYGLIQNTAQLATAQGAIRVLKLLARRYIGWIGVGVAVYSFLAIVWMLGNMKNMDKLVKKWIVISNTINVVAFILFYLSKYQDSYFILYISLSTFIMNGIITLNYYLKTKKLKNSLVAYSKSLNQFYIRFFFIAFFLVFGLMILTNHIKL